MQTRAPIAVEVRRRQTLLPPLRALLCALILFIAVVAPDAGASRIKDLALVEGGRDNQLVGFGLVVGLAGDGDSRLSYTVQSVANALQRFGINVPVETVRGDNVAAVMVTADIPAFAKAGGRIDVTVSSIGDANSLQGGILLQTPLLGADDVVYAVAQGPVVVGGFSAGSSGAGGAAVIRNHPTVGRIPAGAIVEREIRTEIVRNNELRLLLLNPDFTSAARMAEAVNRHFPRSARALDASSVAVALPAEFREEKVHFVAMLEAITVRPDLAARVVINERTGTIVATSRVRISSVAVSHGSLTI
jgi:flagellar P-ring protein FlgI